MLKLNYNIFPGKEVNIPDSNIKNPSQARSNLISNLNILKHT